MAGRPNVAKCINCFADNTDLWCSGCTGNRKCKYTKQLANDPTWRPPTITTRGQQQRTTRPRETPVETQQETEERSKRRRVAPNSYAPARDALRDRERDAAQLREGRRALTTAPRRKRRRSSVLANVPEHEQTEEEPQLLRSELQAAKERVEELEQENQELRRALEEQKRGLKLGFGRRETDKTPTKEEIDDLASFTSDDDDVDEEEDAMLDAEMDDERGYRPTGGAGRPVHTRVPFDVENVTTFSESHLCKHLESNGSLVPWLEIICQGSVGKLRQIVDRLLYRFDLEGYHIKAAVFDRVKAAIDLLKPPPTGFQLFADQRRKEILNGDDFDDDSSESRIQKQISHDWKNLDTEERERRNTEAREANPRRYALSAKASEANRKRYVFALTLVAPPPVRRPDPTSLVPKIARAIGVDPKSTAYLTAISLREAIDDPNNTEATWEIKRKERSDAFTPDQLILVERFWEDNTTPSPSERDRKKHRIGPKEYVYHQAHEQHKKTKALHGDYNNEHKDNKVCYGIFQACKPYYVRPPCAQTCLCRYCENLRLLQKALLLNRNIFLDLDAVRRAAGSFIVRWVMWQMDKTANEQVPTWRRRRGSLSVASLLRCEKKSDMLRLLCCPLAVDSVALMDAPLPVGGRYDGLLPDEVVNAARDAADRAVEGRDADKLADDDRAAAVRAVAAASKRLGAINKAKKRRQRYIRNREACMRCGNDGDCKKCGDINTWLKRDRDFEKHLWGQLDDPEVTIKWSSYRTELCRNQLINLFSGNPIDFGTGTEEDDDGNSKSDNELHKHEDHPYVFNSRLKC